MFVTSARAVLIATLLWIPGMAVAVDPGAIFKSLEGEETRLSEYVGQGKWTLVMLWTSDCHICAVEAPTISGFHDQHKDRDATVLGVAMDGYENKADVISFIDRNSATFPNVIGELAEVAFSYQAATSQALRGTPTFVLFNPAGELVGQQVGPLAVASLEAFISRKSGQ